MEDAGFRVIVPQANFCCGRPFYDFGLLKPAKRYLENILKMLAAEIEAGVPIVVLEPSCCSVFRDELVNLLPHNQNAKRLRAQTFTLAEFLTRRAPDYRAPILKRKAVLHGHCHQKALMTMSADEKLLRRMQVDFEHIDSGCCGMAGAFGYVKGEHYKVSVDCGERVLLPRARQLGSDEILITDGCSCREQVEQQIGKSALHLAEVIQLALATGEREEPPKPSAKPRDDVHAEDQDFARLQRNGNGRRWAVPVGAAAAVAAAAWSVTRSVLRRRK